MDAVLQVDADRRAMMAEVEALKAKRNADSAQVPKLKKAGENVDALLAEMKELSDKITELDKKANEKEEEPDRSFDGQFPTSPTRM